MVDVSDLWEKYSPKQNDYFGLPVEELVSLKKGVVLGDVKSVVSERECGFRTSFLQSGSKGLFGRYLPKIENIFRDQVVVDLGAGATSLGYELANSAGAKAYIGVEPHNGSDLRYSLSKGSIPYSVVEVDMLSFLESLEDDSVSMIAAGIEDNIISDFEYKDSVGKEIQRTLSPSGGLLSISSNIYKSSEDKMDVLGYGYRSSMWMSDWIVRKK